MTAGVPSAMPYDAKDSSSKSSRSAKSAGNTKGTSESGAWIWRERPRWQRWVIAAVVVIASASVVTTPWWGPLALSRLDFFHVRTVEFDGVRFAKTPELLRRLAVDTTQSVWQPLDSLVSRIGEHPMVLSATVVRDLPGTIRVHVTERYPVALVPARGGLRPADATGSVLPIDPSVSLLDLPVAASGDSTLLSVLDALRQNAPELYARISSANRVAADELRFTLSGSEIGAAGPSMANALIVRTSPDVTVARFRDILPVEADLARNHLRAVELDLRFRDQVIARQP